MDWNLDSVTYQLLTWMDYLLMLFLLLVCLSIEWSCCKVWWRQECMNSLPIIGSITDQLAKGPSSCALKSTAAFALVSRLTPTFPHWWQNTGRVLRQACLWKTRAFFNGQFWLRDFLTILPNLPQTDGNIGCFHLTSFPLSFTWGETCVMDRQTFQPLPAPLHSLPQAFPPTECLHVLFCLGSYLFLGEPKLIHKDYVR